MGRREISLRTFGLVQKLHEKEIVSNPDSLRLILRVMGLEKKIKAGVYQIETDDNLWRLIERITSGKTKSFSFTIVEGVTFKQIIEKLKSTKYIDTQVDNLLGKSFLEALGIERQSPEGLFFS